MLDFQPANDFFIGIDSDGCAFDTMEVKHKECFIPNIIKFYHLAAVSKYAREAAEFVNLYSVHRGENRFPALVRAFDLLTERAEVKKRGMTIPKLESVRQWIASESKLGNPALAAAVERTNDPELKHLLAWSKAVNDTVEEVVHKVPPFPLVRESIANMQGKADVLVCSATPNAALEKEWSEHALRPMVARICGQEVGTKKEILQLASKYKPGQSLMIGDAPGDWKAAVANNVLFYPINPGGEDESWARFYQEALPRFFAGNYAGDYELACIKEFEKCLPAKPNW